MDAFMMGMLAETPVHVGIGQQGGVVDLPVARERPTGLPMIPSTGLKGALRQAASFRYGAGAGAGVDGEEPEEVRFLFGTPPAEEVGQAGAALTPSSRQQGAAPGRAGYLLFSDARLLLLPVRSLTETYRLVTCPLVLQRLQRDGQRLFGADFFANRDHLPAIAASTALIRQQELGELALDERHFHAQAEPGYIQRVAAQLARFADNDAYGRRLADHLTVLCNDDFAWFCKNALPVMAHNKLDPETKSSEALWYEESLPVDSLLYAMVVPRTGITDDQGFADRWCADLLDDGYLQVGGNETTGQGWLRVEPVPPQPTGPGP